MARLSGLQKEVLNLYRQCLRETRKKPDVITHPFLNPTARSLERLERRKIWQLLTLGFQVTRKHFEAFARSEFNKNLAIEKRDFAAIEFLLRKGRRQLESYSAPGIKDIK